MKYNFLTLFLRVVCSGLFILSAISKLYPTPTIGIQIFEENQLFTLGFNETLAMIFSRFLISLEIAIGIGFLLPFSKNWVTYPVAFILLVIFNTHLGIVIFGGMGNQGNCGCFGELIHMTPLEAWIKNWIALVFIAILFLKRNRTEHSIHLAVPTIALAFQISLLYLSPPIPSSVVQNQPISAQSPTMLLDSLYSYLPDSSLKIESVIGLDSNMNYVLDSNEIQPLYRLSKTIRKASNQVKIEPVSNPAPTPSQSKFSNFYPGIDNGKKIVCVFSPDCPHCKEAAKEVAQYSKKELSGIEICILFKDTQNPNQINDFFAYCGKSFPYQLIPRNAFLKFLSSLNLNSPPGIFFLWNGNILEQHSEKDQKIPIQTWVRKFAH